MEVTESFAWDNSIPEPNTGCWLWLHGIGNHGYGVAYDGHRSWRAHRLAYAIANGPIPPGALVLHSCDNRACINPAHLRAGSYKDNHDDMTRRGRRADMRGIHSPAHKLTEAQASAAFSDPRPVSVIAAELGVTTWTIYGIKQGRRWSHLARTQETANGN